MEEALTEDASVMGIESAGTGAFDVPGLGAGAAKRSSG